MPTPIITVKEISKDYVITHRSSYETLRDSLTELIVKPFRKDPKANTHEQFWALKNVSFTVGAGERIGIIGRNGAGKSTLLKILSQITSPTSGSVTLRGRVASLLEVGTGFHPELTGRENIFLNGAILGMKQAEIRKKFDEIVAFSEIEKFLDTPVKRYSSGMYVRLAFAVAAHLDPEILIVDEVLAVGDAQFQKKCLGKMQDVAKQGRTVIFVSHNMSAINQLCERVILLRDGQIAADGTPDKVISQYLTHVREGGGRANLEDPSLRKNSLEHSAVKWKAISILNHQGQPTEQLAFQEPFSLELRVNVLRPINDARLGFAIQSALGFPIFNSFQSESGLATTLEPGEYVYRIRVANNPLAPGLYEVSLGANGPSVIDWIPSAIQFTVTTVGINPAQSWENYRGGIITHPVSWEIHH